LTRWTILGECIVDHARRARLSIAKVELPDRIRSEQYVLRVSAGGDDHTVGPIDVNEAERIGWIPLDALDLIARGEIVCRPSGTIGSNPRTGA
jgi:hypothetical protein